MCDVGVALQLLAEMHPKAPSRKATWVLNHETRRHSAARGEYEPRFLNGQQRSVNRKVQGSNPCPGASFPPEPVSTGASFRIKRRRVSLYVRCWLTAIAQQRAARESLVRSHSELQLRDRLSAAYFSRITPKVKPATIYRRPITIKISGRAMAITPEAAMSFQMISNCVTRP